MDWCGPPIDRNNAHFSAPDWQPMDYKANLDIVEMMFLGGEYVQAWVFLYRKKFPDGSDAYEVARKEYWRPLKQKVLAGFESGRARLEAADFDIDNDGSADRVIRMTSWQVVPAPASDRESQASEREVKFSEPCYPGEARYRYFRLGERPSGGVGKYLSSPGYLFQFDGATYFGLSPYRFSLTSRGAGSGLSFFLSGDQPEQRNTCFISR
jgi:hypothetical protein